MAYPNIGAVGNLDIGAVQSLNTSGGITIDLTASGLELESYGVNVLVTQTVNLNASALELESYSPDVIVSNVVNLSVSNLYLRSFNATVIVGTPTGIGFRIFDDENEIVY